MHGVRQLACFRKTRAFDCRTWGSTGLWFGRWNGAGNDTPSRRSFFVFFRLVVWSDCPVYKAVCTNSLKGRGGNTAPKFAQRSVGVRQTRAGGSRRRAFGISHGKVRVGGRYAGRRRFAHCLVAHASLFEWRSCGAVGAAVRAVGTVVMRGTDRLDELGVAPNDAAKLGVAAREQLHNSMYPSDTTANGIETSRKVLR